MMRWTDLGWLPDPYPVPLLPLPHLQAGQENKMKRFMDQDKDKKITQQLLSQTNQTWLGDNEFKLLPIKVGLDSTEQKQN